MSGEITHNHEEIYLRDMTIEFLRNLIDIDREISSLILSEFEEYERRLCIEKDNREESMDVEDNIRQNQRSTIPDDHKYPNIFRVKSLRE
jgi:hypothetical protein